MFKISLAMQEQWMEAHSQFTQSGTETDPLHNLGLSLLSLQYGIAFICPVI